LAAFTEFENRAAKHNQNAEAFHRDLQALADGTPPTEPVKTAATLAKRRIELAQELVVLHEAGGLLKQLLKKDFEAWQAEASKAHAESKAKAQAFIMGHFPTDVGLQQKATASVIKDSFRDLNWQPAILSPYWATPEQQPEIGLARAKHQVCLAILKASGCFEMVDWPQSKTV
jgi:hypothetical protein